MCRWTCFSSSGGGFFLNIKVTIGGVELKNPVLTASGTFGSGMEYKEFIDLNCLKIIV